MGEMRAQGIAADAKMKGGMDLVRAAAHERGAHDRADSPFQQIGLAQVEVFLGKSARFFFQCRVGGEWQDVANVWAPAES
jgi:hypothetical protein